MGAHPSKQRSSAPGAHPSTSTTASTSKPQDDQLVSYEAACRQDPEIHTIDTTIRSRMSRCISSIAVGVEVRALSLDSLREVTGTLLDMNQEVVKVILECKKDVWKDPELFDLVEDYFECSLQTLDFCTALDKCLKKARDAQLIVSLALQRFDDEDEDGGTTHAADNNNRYRRALDELRAFRAVGDPFTDDFFQQFRAVYTQQLHMLDRLQARKGKLDKKLKAAKAWRKVSSVIFISACAAVLICSVVAAAMAAPPVAAALAAAASAPLGSMGKWIDSLWAKYEDAIKAQKELVSSISVGTYVAVKDLDNIRVLVDALEINIDALLRGADFALAGGGQGNSGQDGEIDLAAVRVGVEEVRRKLSAFTKGIEELGEQADRCSRDIRRARTVVLQRIIKQPNSH